MLPMALIDSPRCRASRPIANAPTAATKIQSNFFIDPLDLDRSRARFVWRSTLFGNLLLSHCAADVAPLGAHVTGDGGDLVITQLLTKRRHVFPAFGGRQLRKSRAVQNYVDQRCG